MICIHSDYEFISSFQRGDILFEELLTNEKQSII